MLYTQVYRHDSPSPLARCRIFGDPHVITYEARTYESYYSIYMGGKFIYARSTSGLPFEVRRVGC